MVSIKKALVALFKRAAEQVEGCKKNNFGLRNVEVDLDPGDAYLKRIGPLNL
jgi:hypothetical protein